MDETRRAAERLTGDWDKTYPPVPHTATVDAVLLDTARVAKAYLTEHPADDGEPLTADWLDAITRDKEGASHWRLSNGPRAAGAVAVEVVMRPSYCTVEVCGRLLREWWPLADDAGRRQYTRGDLRRLCAALGIDLD